MALLRRTRTDASAWIAPVGLAAASVGTLADLILNGFPNVTKRIDGASRHLAEIPLHRCLASPCGIPRKPSVVWLAGRHPTPGFA